MTSRSTKTGRWAVHLNTTLYKRCDSEREVIETVANLRRHGGSDVIGVLYELNVTDQFVPGGSACALRGALAGSKE